MEQILAKEEEHADDMNSLIETVSQYEKKFEELSNSGKTSLKEAS
jgi:bacterioferritin (cytochrome b1)